MKILLSAAVLALLGFSFIACERQGADPRWLDDFDRAVELAAETERPILLVFR